MSEKTYVVNVKTKAGTIFTVRADSATELNSNIQEVVALSVNDSVLALEELLTGVTSFTVNATDVVLNTLGGQVVDTTPTPTTFAPVPPPQTATAQNVGSRMCNHGPMIARKGTGAKGEWKGLFCPTPKGTAGQCEPIWLKRTDAEWATI